MIRKILNLSWCKLGLHSWKQAPFSKKGFLEDLFMGGFQKCARCGRWRAYIAHGLIDGIDHKMKFWWDLLEKGIDFDVYGNISGSPKDTGLTFLPDVKYHSPEQISEGVVG